MCYANEGPRNDRSTNVCVWAGRDGAQLGLRQCEGVEIHLCVCSMSERQKQRTGAAENSEECSCTLEAFVHKSALSLTHICTHTHKKVHTTERQA